MKYFICESWSIFYEAHLASHVTNSIDWFVDSIKNSLVRFIQNASCDLSCPLPGPRPPSSTMGMTFYSRLLTNNHLPYEYLNILILIKMSPARSPVYDSPQSIMEYAHIFSE